LDNNLNGLLTLDQAIQAGPNPTSPTSSDFSSVADCIAWYQPSNPSGVSTSRGTVTGLIDLSGSGNNANVPSNGGTGPTPTAPTVVSNAVNGLQALNFDGVANQIGIDAVASLISGVVKPLHIFMVAQFNAASGTQVLLDLTSRSAEQRDKSNYDAR